MQALKRLFLSAFIFVTMTLGFVLLNSGLVSAQYGSDNYGGSGGSFGQCAYGLPCPVDPGDGDPIIIDPVEEPEEEETTETTPDQTEPEIIAPIENQETPSGGSTNTTEPSKKKASDQVEAKGLQGIILKQAVDVVEKIPENQRVVAPYYSWLLLLILSAILLLIAAIDRYKSVKLVKSIKQLRNVLQEQSNFLRLALHNLNTPLATTKGALELLEHANPSEPEAVEKLKPATLELASTIEATTTEVTSEVEEGDKSPNLISKKVNIFSNIGQWYFFVPVIVAVLFGLLINSALRYTDTGKPSNYGIIQIAVAVMVCLIFANAIRVLKISNRQQRVYSEAQRLINQLNNKRVQIILTLSESLGNVTKEVREACKLISDQKLAAILRVSIGSLESLAYKVKAATTALSAKPELVSVPGLIDEVVEPLQTLTEAKLITIKNSDSLTEQTKVFVPELKLIVKSIIENSIEYGKDNGKIEVKSKIKDGKLVIKIKDDGIGIEKDAIENLFKPFSKADDVLTYDHQGMGMSLYVSSTVAKRLGGNIKIASEKGQGTTATVSMPLN